MNILRTNIWLTVVLVTLAGCAIEPSPGRFLIPGGTKTDPFLLSIPINTVNCPTGDVPNIEYGAACDSTHKKALCVEKNQWVSWESTGNEIELIEPKPGEKKFLEQCKLEPAKLDPTTKVYKCQVRKLKKDKVYKYAITLRDCTPLDPKIIITN